MVIKQSEKIFTETCINEHNTLLQQSSQISEMLILHINSLSEKLKNRQRNLASIEEMILWKSDFKKVLWGLWDYLKDHVERETAFLDSFTGHGLKSAELTRNEEVMEHVDEMTWLINNTPARQMPHMLSYFQQKMAELCQGITEHCQKSDQILKQFAEGN